MNRLQAAALDVRAFLAQLETWGELHRVPVAVDPCQEIAAVTDRVSKAGGPALCFEQVTGSRLPVLTNLFGTERRAALAVGAESAAAAAARLAALLDEVAGATGNERLAQLLARAETLPYCGADLLQAAAVDLTALPALQGWPGDGGRHFTLPLVITRDAESGTVNCGLYRVQRLGPTTAALRWHPQSDAARQHAGWRRRGAAMPVAIVLGAPPALLCAAAAPLPPDVDEFACAGLLAGVPLALAPRSWQGLPLPALAEVVLEGWVDPQLTALEGPFGNHTGYYAAAGAGPLFTLTGVRQRPAALCPATVVGPPPMEDCWLAQLIARLWLPLLRCDFPQLLDLAQPQSGIFHGCTLLAVRGTADGSGAALLKALWQIPFFRRSRLLILLDAETDVHDFALSFWRVVNQCDPGRDLVLDEGRVGIDARGGGLGPRLVPAAEMRRQIRQRWAEYGLAALLPLDD